MRFYFMSLFVPYSVSFPCLRNAEFRDCDLFYVTSFIFSNETLCFYLIIYFSL